MHPLAFPLLLIGFAAVLPAHAQQPPYDTLPPAVPPYYRVRYEAPAEPKPGELVYGVSYTVWVPSGVKNLRGLIVHQHGCGEGSCKSGQTGAFDLHWQALAKKHDCALMAPVYEQPETANCQLWCDPRNGSDAAFQKSLTDLGIQAGHPELAEVPWALWGHSGGGHWAGGMMLLHPGRVAAVWLRSGLPPLEATEGKPPAYPVPAAVYQIPIMCNLGTKEGVTVKEGRFSKAWGNAQSFFSKMRPKGALVGIAVDPLTSHECGNQRYLAIPWFDTCLTARLPNQKGDALKPIPAGESWLAELNWDTAQPTSPLPAANFKGALEKSVWLPTEAIAKAWTQYVKDTVIPDGTPPPAPTDIHLTGTELTWQAEADLESGLAGFVIERDGKLLARIPEQAKNPFGRPVFQNLSYSDTPTQPLMRMRFTDTKQVAGQTHQYRVSAVNTAGLQSAAGSP